MGKADVVQRQGVAGTRWRLERAMAVVLAVAGVSVFVAAGAMLAGIPDQLGAYEPAARAQVPMILLFQALPAGVGGLLALLAARRLWCDRPGASSLAGVWAVGAAVLAAILSSGFGSLAWAVRVLVWEPDRWFFDWPWLRYDPDDLVHGGTPIENLPGTRLDDVYTWYPGVLALGAVAVIGLLLARRLARGAGDAR